MGSIFTKGKELNSSDLNGIAEHLKTCKNVIVMSGAGISTKAGIPDFRSPEFGLYNRLEKFNLPHPTAVFTLNYFKENPRAFYTIAHELYPILEKARPTLTHIFIKLLNDKGILLRHYTQNVDGLDLLTGLPQDKLIEAHGQIRTGSCIECQEAYSIEFLKEHVLKDEVPKCKKCNSWVKPDVVLFGEGLPSVFYKSIPEFWKCDLLIILGTSLVVQPFASLAKRVGNGCPRLLINRDEIGESEMSGMLSWLLDPKFKIGIDSRDVFYQGDVDDGCLKLAELLGWKEDLEKLLEEENKHNFNIY